MTQRTTSTILFILFDILALLFFSCSLYLEYQQLEVERATHAIVEGMWSAVLEGNP